MLALKMLVLKVLMFKNNKQQQQQKQNKKTMRRNIYYKQRLSLFGRDDTRQAKSLIFIVVPQPEQVGEVTKKTNGLCGLF